MPDIIVYRSPLEKAIYDLICNPSWITISIIGIAIVAGLTISIYNNRKQRQKMEKHFKELQIKN